MRARSVLAALLAFTLIAAACGGDDSAPDAAPEPETDVSAQQPEAEPSPESDDGGGSEAGDGSATDDGGGDDSSSSGAPAASAGSPPNPTDFLPYAPEPSIWTQPSPAATPEEHLTALWATVVDIVLSDRRAADANLFSEMDGSVSSSAPDLALASISASASLSVETLSAIEAYARSALDAGYDPELTEYFRIRAEGAAAIGQLNQLIYDAVMTARDMSYHGRRCLSRAILNDNDDCEDDPAADALIKQLIEASNAVEVPDDLDEADDDLPSPFDFCGTWEPVLADMGGLAQIFDLLIEDALIEYRFLGREECRFEASLDGGPEDEIVWGPQQATDAYTELYAQVAAAGIDAPFDEVVYDNPDYEVVLPLHRETVIAHMNAGAGAADLIGGVAEPRARLGLITIAWISAVERWWQQVILAAGLDDQEDPYRFVFEDLLSCVPEPFATPLDTAGCTPDEARTAELVLSVVEFTDYETGAEDPEVIDWEDVQEAFPLCEIWAAVLAAIPPEQAVRVDFQTSQLGTEELLGMDGCETGIAQPGSDTSGDDG